MKNIQNKLIVVLSIFLAFPHLGSLQDSLTSKQALSFEVNRIYPFISVTKETLNKAHTLTDLHDEANKLDHYYKSS